MKDQPYNSSRDSKDGGYALVVAIVLTAIIASAVGASLRYVGTELRLTRHSTARVQAIHAAEAGLELALDAFDSVLQGGAGWSGWTAVGNSYERAITNLLPEEASALSCEFFVTANTNTLMVTATGTVTSAFLDDEIIRGVQIVLETSAYHPYEFGMLGKSHVQLTGNSFMDSFDSTDPTKSTGGRYVPAKAQANITIATMSSDPSSAIHGAGNSTVRGDLKTAPGGGLQSGGNFAYTGTFADDLDVEIPDVTVPWTLSPPFSTSLNINNAGSSRTISISGDTDLEYGSISVSGKGELTFTGNGKLRIYVDGQTQVSGKGQIIIDNAAPGNNLQVEFYVNDHTQLTGLVLGSGLASDLAIMGTTNCTHIHYSGKSDYIGVVYAPQANFHISGQGGMVGAAVGDTVQMTGQGDFHYDESLGDIILGSVGAYEIISWVEL